MDKDGFRIVKGLPIPRESAGKKNKYPFDEMEVGDCLKFEATSRLDDGFKRIYASAFYHARKSGSGFNFRFAKIDDRHYGCWKVAVAKRGEAGSEGRSKSRGEPKAKRKRRTMAEIRSIPVEAIREAWHSEGTVAGAARKVGLHPSTYERIISRLTNKK